MDSEEDRGIGENLCQLPPLLLLSRAGAEPEVPALGAELQFELPRVSGRDTALFSGRAGRDPMLDDPATVCSPDCPKRRNPLFELTFDLTFELVFPGLTPSRPPPVNLPSCRLPFATCGRPS